MKKTKLTFFSDGGHGWLGVKRSLLKELGIFDKVSSFSYQKGSTVYLEEDCDVSLFAETLFKLPGNEGKKLDEIFEIKRSYTDNRSPVRSYPRFSPNTIEELKEGMKVRLYGKEYILSKGLNGKWLISGETGRYRISKTQESELFEVKDVPVMERKHAEDDGVNYEA